MLLRKIIGKSLRTLRPVLALDAKCIHIEVGKTKKDISKMRVAVIGAGPSGLAALRAFQSAKDKGAEVPEIVCFEKQSNWGGLWNYQWRTGLDAFGEPVHGSMYRYLWSNGPKECLEFSDYSFEEHFGKPIASYPPRAVLFDYIQGRVLKAGVRQYCRFNSPVRSVQYTGRDGGSGGSGSAAAPEGHFEVTWRDCEADVNRSERFDHVVCASGHYSTPNLPEFPGSSNFHGRLLHAHDFRDALEFVDKDILLVGASYSAEDIGSQCYKYGARSITSCYRTKPMPFTFPSNWEQKPNLVRLEGHDAHFLDGSIKRVDAVVFCTGYQHYFPFLPDSLRLRTNNRLWPLGLYKGVFFEENTQMMYLGMQDQFYTFNMFDAQAWYARDVILGRIALPATKEEMMTHSQSWRDRELTLENPEQMIEFQGDYVKELVEATDYPAFDIDGVNKAFFEWEHSKVENIMEFRNKGYRSLKTGTLAPSHHTPWLEAMDDSMETYLISK